MGLAGVMRGSSTAGAEIEINESCCADCHWEIMTLEDHTSMVLLCMFSDASMLKLTVRTAWCLMTPPNKFAKPSSKDSFMCYTPQVTHALSNSKDRIV